MTSTGLTLTLHRPLTFGESLLNLYTIENMCLQSKDINFVCIKKDKAAKNFFLNLALKISWPTTSPHTTTYHFVGLSVCIQCRHFEIDLLLFTELFVLVCSVLLWVRWSVAPRSWESGCVGMCCGVWIGWLWSACQAVFVYHHIKSAHEPASIHHYLPAQQISDQFK